MLRCRASSLGDVLTYQGACAFKRPLAIAELTAKHVQAVAASGDAHRARRAAAGWQKVAHDSTTGGCVRIHERLSSVEDATASLGQSRSGESTFIPLSQLKALFFVREFAGDPTLIEMKVFSEPQQGRKMEVTFRDNEIMVGSTLTYRGAGNGFFLKPADPRSNNLRVFVTAAGMQQVRFVAREPSQLPTAIIQLPNPQVGR